MRLLTIAAVTAGIWGMVSAGYADEILRYGGNQFSSFLPPYTGNDAVAAWIDTARLPDDCYDCAVSLKQWKITDGTQTLDSSNSELSLDVTTNSSGQLLGWKFLVYTGHSYGEGNVISSNWNLFAPYGDYASNDGAYAYNSNEMGWWQYQFAVPEPTSIALLVTGLIGLTFVRQRHVQRTRSAL